MTTLWIIRHAETEWALSGRHTGRTDLPLTSAGEAQARRIGHGLGNTVFALVLTSPLRRAAETCRLAGYGAIARPDDDLMEYDYGVFEGRTSEEIRRERPQWSIWNGPVPGGETLEQVASRVDRVLERVSGIEGDVALFAHGHLLRILAARFLELPPSSGRLFALDPASVSVLGRDGGAPVIQRWNGTFECAVA